MSAAEDSPRAGQPVVAVYRGGHGVPLRVPQNPAIQERDVLWCKSLICALGEDVINTKQMERILHIFNQNRPEKARGRDEQ